eukprot:1411866-Pyramimonas_sp.AAC.1
MQEQRSVLRLFIGAHSWSPYRSAFKKLRIRDDIGGENRLTPDRVFSEACPSQPGASSQSLARGREGDKGGEKWWKKKKGGEEGPSSSPRLVSPRSSVPCVWTWFASPPCWGPL